MKLVTYTTDLSILPGILTENGIVDIPSAWQGADAPRSVKEILMRGDDCFAKLRELAESAAEFIQLSDVQLLQPVYHPSKVLALAGNYAKHVAEAGLKLGLSDSPREATVPRPFLMPSTVLTGDTSEIAWPVYSEQLDYEIELAIVIGKTARCVSPDDAAGYIAGFSVFNDVSARSVTFKDGRAKRPWDEFYDWLGGKWADGFAPMGPYLLTADEVADVQNLDMELKVNGQTRQKANTCEMIYSAAETVSFLSHLMTLNAGDIIATGTPAGVGMADGRFLQPGDKIECTIEKLGTLTNTIGPKPKDFYRPLQTAGPEIA